MGFRGGLHVNVGLEWSSMLTPGNGVPYGPRDVRAFIRENTENIDCLVTRYGMRRARGPIRVGHDSFTTVQLGMIGHVCFWRSVVGSCGRLVTCRSGDVKWRGVDGWEGARVVHLV